VRVGDPAELDGADRVAVEVDHRGEGVGAQAGAVEAKLSDPLALLLPSLTFGSAQLGALHTASIQTSRRISRSSGKSPQFPVGEVGYTPLMEQPELRRRIGAALRYAGLNQEEMGVRFKADGLGSEDPGQIQRGKKAMQLAQAEAFARHTGFPVAWFMDAGAGPRVLGEDETRELLDDLLAAVTLLAAERGEDSDALRSLQAAERRRERRREGAGNG
jgi:hypothetical protein